MRRVIPANKVSHDYEKIFYICYCDCYFGKPQSESFLQACVDIHSASAAYKWFLYVLFVGKVRKKEKIS